MIDLTKLRIGVIQLLCKLNRYESNIRRASRYMDKAAEEGVKLLCLPEGFSTSSNLLSLSEISETIPGKTTDFLCEKAKGHGMYIVAGIFEKEIADKEKYYSTTVLIDDQGEVLGSYRRVHAIKLEQRFLHTGDSYGVFATGIGKIALISGYDINFSESCKQAFKEKAEIIVCPCLIPNQYSYITKHLAVARAMENSCFFVLASSIGENQFAGFTYMGNSLIACCPIYLEEEKFDFMEGDEILAQAGDTEKLIVATVNLESYRRFAGKNELYNGIREDIR